MRRQSGESWFESLPSSCDAVHIVSCRNSGGSHTCWKRVQEACHACRYGRAPAVAGMAGMAGTVAGAAGPGCAGGADVAPGSGLPGGRIAIRTRRLALRPAAVAFDCSGLYCARPMTDSREGSMPLLAITWTTLAARAEESSQLEGNVVVSIGWLSVWPSTRTGFGSEARVCDSLRMTPTALGDSVALPLGNRMSVRISTSIVVPLRRTTTRSDLIRSDMAVLTSSATLSRA